MSTIKPGHLPLSLAFTLGLGLVIVEGGCGPSSARAARTQWALARCRRRADALRDELRSQQRQLGELQRALARVSERLARGHGARPGLGARGLPRELRRLMWFQRALCRDAAVRRAQAVFQARLREIQHDKLVRQLGQVRPAWQKRRLGPRVARAARELALATARRREAVEILRRCRLYLASSALRPRIPPPAQRHHPVVPEPHTPPAQPGAKAPRPGG